MVYLDSWLAVVGVAAVFLLAGVVKGVVGLGLPTVAMGLLSLGLAPAQAAALLIVPSLVSNVWQSAGPNLGMLVRRLWPLWLMLAVGAGLGAWAFGPTGSGPVAQVLLGVALLAYATLSLAAWRPQVPPRAQRWAAPLAGAVTGLLTAATGVFAIPAVPYLQALDLPKDTFVQALGLTFLVATVALAAALQREGELPTGTWWASTAALVPTLLGMACGQRMRSHLSPELFRRAFLIGLAALGLALTVKALA